jgi:TrmH family RNA methyltransferase
VQRLRRLIRQRSVRRRDRAFVAEGAKLLGAALDAAAPIEAIYHAPEAEASPGAAAVLGRARAAGIRVFGLGPGVIERVADATTPQPLLGVVGMVDVGLAEVLDAPLLFVLVDVRDPGNLGAILRVAGGCGAGGVICCEGSADVYNPKTVRASAGSLFSVPVVSGIPPDVALAELGVAGYRRTGTAARGGEDFATADLGARVALVFGNEAQGLDATLAAALDAVVSIPMAAATESLNVATAAAVLGFALARHLRAQPGGPYDEPT